MEKTDDEFAWLEPMRKRTRELEEETKRIREEQRLTAIKTEKPPAYLTQESPWNKLGAEEISDLHSILIYCKEKGLYEELRHNTSACVEIEVERLEKILENIMDCD